MIKIKLGFVVVLSKLHLIEGLNRRENLIQWTLFEVVVVNTVEHNIDLRKFAIMSSRIFNY